MPSKPGRLMLAGFAAACAWLFLASPSVAQQTRGLAPSDPETVAQIKAQNASCLSCHSEAGLRAPPRADLDLKKLSKTLVDASLFGTSIHTGMACATCHVGGYRDYPHAAGSHGKPETLNCDECHAQKTARIEPQVARSVHSKNLMAKFTCSSCHDAHVYQTASKLRDPALIVAQDNAMCLGCHNSDAKFAEYAASLPTPKKRPDLEKIHEWLPNTKMHWSAVRCVECHTPVSTNRALSVSHEVFNKDKAERNCVTCHTQNTALRTRLYRWQAETEGARLGFSNSALIGQTYVIGATRNTLFDAIGLGLIALAFAGAVGHGLIRILARLGRGVAK